MKADNNNGMGVLAVDASNWAKSQSAVWTRLTKTGQGKILERRPRVVVVL